MTDYTKATNFATKDALVTGDPLKVVKGTEIDDEFNAIEDSIETKADLASPTFTGIPKAPTAAAGTNTTQLATTAFVTDAVSSVTVADNAITNAKMADNSVGADEIIDNSVGADELNVSGDGTAGQFLISDGDGSFSWTAISVLSPAASNPTTRDDGTALAEGDQYYNTADDVIKTYDGSAWNEVSYDPAGGSTGTTSIPPIGSIVLGSFNTSTQNINHWTGGYGSTQTLSSTAWVDTGYNWKYTTSGTGGIVSGNTITINSGTWQLLGGSYYLDPNVNANWVLILRVS